MGNLIQLLEIRIIMPAMILCTKDADESWTFSASNRQQGSKCLCASVLRILTERHKAGMDVGTQAGTDLRRCSECVSFDDSRMTKSGPDSGQISTPQKSQVDNGSSH